MLHGGSLLKPPCQRIVVLEDGHVAQQGAPAELMEQGGLYRRMVELQSESAQWRLNGAEA